MKIAMFFFLGGVLGTSKFGNLQIWLLFETKSIYLYIYLYYVDTWRFLFEGSLCSFLGMGSSIPSEVGGISPQEETANVIEMLIKKKERSRTF